MNARNNQYQKCFRVVGVGGVLGLLVWLVFSPSKLTQPVSKAPEPLDGLLLPQATKATSGDLRVEIRRILGQVAGIGSRQRLNLLRACEPNLRQSECQALLGELSQPRAIDVDPGWYAEYFHEVALALGSQGGDHERFARVLAAVAVDSDRDAVIRDYAVQHLRRVWERSAAEPNLRGTIVASLRRFVRDEPEISGAALLSLHLLESQPAIPGKAAEPAITTKELEHLMHHTLNDGASRRDPRTTMGILRIVGARRMLGLAPDVRQLVSDNSQHALVRMSGIAALADLGQQMDRDFLSSLDQPDPRIIKAVKSALDRLP